MAAIAIAIHQSPKSITVARSLTFTARQFEAHAADAAHLLKVLANEHRLGILCLLVEREMSVGEINARIDLSQSALSQHLAVLRNERLVTTRRDAQVIFYALADGPVHQIIETLHGVYCVPARRKVKARAKTKTAARR
jgi:ArsR family transcriptional regulator, virulence genes transcriptional regulator